MKKERNQLADLLGTLFVLGGALLFDIGIWLALPAPVALVIYGILFFLAGCALCCVSDHL